MTIRCLRCHRVLKDPAWATRRYGKRCAELVGLVAVRSPAPVPVKAAPKTAAAENGSGQLELFELEEVTE